MTDIDSSSEISFPVLENFQMQKSPLPSRRLRNYSNIPFEILIMFLTILPFFVLAYFYSLLPERVPLFLNLVGDVEVWTEKSVLSVFRVPLMAVAFQVIASMIVYPVLVFLPV